MTNDTPSAAKADRRGWLPIESAPRDGTAILAYGVHDRDNTPGAQRGVKSGDHWWGIVVWDVWRIPKWVFSKDGAFCWTDPTHWQPLPAPPETDHD